MVMAFLAKTEHALERGVNRMAAPFAREMFSGLRTPLF